MKKKFRFTIILFIFITIIFGLFFFIFYNNDVKYYKNDYVHISFDDVELSFNNLAKKEYKSLFDEPFFGWLQKMNSKYGAKFSLYTYSETLNSVPNTYINDFKNIDYIKIGLHAQNANSTYKETTYNEAYTEWNLFTDNVIRITGDPSFIDRIPRLHYFEGNKNALLGFRDANWGGARLYN